MTTSKNQDHLKELISVSEDVVVTWKDYVNGEEVHMWLAIAALQKTIEKIKKDLESEESLSNW